MCSVGEEQETRDKEKYDGKWRLELAQPPTRADTRWSGHVNLSL